MRKFILTLILASLALHARALETADAATNRLVRIIASGNYNFTIAYGRMGALALDGYATPSGRGFRAKIEDRELFRVVDKNLWLPSTGTGGAVIVAFDFPVVITVGYGGDRAATLGFGTMPPQKPDPFVLANYRGLGVRAADLPVVRQTKDGWKYSETNETGTSIEIADDDTSRVAISLLKTEEDRSSIFIHELRMNAGPPPQKLELPPATRTVALHDYSSALTLCTRIVQVLQHDAILEPRTPDIFKVFSLFVDRAASGYDIRPPALPLSQPPQRLKDPAKP